MKTIGIRCTKETFDWAVVGGPARSVAAVLEQQAVTAPDGDRGEQLSWVRKEVLELLERVAPDAVAVGVAEGGGRSVSLGRSEIEGVVQEAISTAGVDLSRQVSATIRSCFHARTNALLQPALNSVPAISGTAKSRREPVISAVSLLPE